jgi:hypothetical protein
MTSLHPKDLHPVYQSVPYEEAIAIANLGAQVYEVTRTGLFDLWNAGQTAEEVVKADLLRREGGQAMLESLKKQLAAGEAAVARAAALQTSIDEKVESRIAEVLDTHRKDFELAKMAEIHVVEKKLASIEGKEKYFSKLEEAHVAMVEKIAILESLSEEKKAASTKSSHAIGKQGEATVLEMLEDTVMSTFPYSEVVDMTAIHHAADFHLWIMSSSGKRIKILVDSKKYTQPVNSAEVAKLNKDVDADEEAHCGILISLVSSIAAKKQFQIKNTQKQKPIIYLTFQNMDNEMKKEILCWAIHSLLAIIGEADQDARIKMLETIDNLLDGINSSVKELDGVIRTQIKALEGLRLARSGIIHKLSSFREGKHVDDADVEEEDVPETVGGCVTILKSTGSPCGRSVLDKSNKCKQHTSRNGSKSKVQHC